MALSIKGPETERLAWNLARLTGENITTATKRALEERDIGGRALIDFLVDPDVALPNDDNV